MDRYTRDKTSKGRLVELDRLIKTLFRENVKNAKLVVDMGIGHTPFTTIEMHDNFKTTQPHIKTIGIDNNHQCIKNARRYHQSHGSDPNLKFIKGSFDIIPQNTSILRIFNLFRQSYTMKEIDNIHDRLRGRLRDCLVVEGMSTLIGDIFVADIYRYHRGEVKSLGLIFHNRFSEKTDPKRFQKYLPKRYLGQMMTDNTVAQFMKYWSNIHQSCSHLVDERERWSYIGKMLSEEFKMRIESDHYMLFIQ